jgi:elongation factor P
VEREMQFLYRDGETFHLMDNETYEQLGLTAEQMGDAVLFLTENLTVKVLIFNQQPVGVEPPNFVELTVAQAEPGLKGDTASGGNKPATLESGAVIQVPLFINEGDRVKVDTRTGVYIERAK